MKATDFDFDLPLELIAQTPLLNRSESRLLVLNRKDESITHKHFYDIIDYLKPGDVLVRNNTKVIPARLIGIKEGTGAHVELLILNHHDEIYECLVGNARAVKLGTIIDFGEGKLKAECIEVKDEGIRLFKMIYQGIFLEILDELGSMPLPPYIKEKLKDKDRYQTVYAKIEGSAAAPTAGFHFTEELLTRIKEKGVEIVDVTLHIGLGTFRPMGVEDIKDHIMHEEYYMMSKEAAASLNKAKSENRRIIAVGTTSVRTLETIYSKFNTFIENSGYTKIFIYPGYEFKAIDGLITNFHLPKSTLIMLVSAFANKEYIFKAYKEAIDHKYRFFSFGDSMFIY
jgi:S-adenosylmethionine:tRNA ribosyltransferase-isomerase